MEWRRYHEPLCSRWSGEGTRTRVVQGTDNAPKRSKSAAKKTKEKNAKQKQQVKQPAKSPLKIGQCSMV